MTQGSPYTGPVPPIVPAAIIVPPRKAVWPTVIGVIAIVFASLSILQALAGLLLPLMMSFMDKMFSNLPPGQPNPLAGMREYMGWFAAMSISSGLAAVLLLTCGIGLTKRRPWVVPAIRVWAVLKIVIEAGSSVVTAMMQTHQMQTMMTTSASSARGTMPPPEFFIGFAIVGAVVGFVIYSLFAVFMLIWFRVRSVREETAKWQAAAPAPPTS